MPEKSVYRVEIRTSVVGRFRVRHADLIFKHRKPFIVLSWESGADGRDVPGVVTGIDRDNLTKLESESGLLSDYLYTGTVIGLE
jgi:hypothetical protein